MAILHTTLVRRMSRHVARRAIALRVSGGWSVDQVSKASGLSRRTIERIESGVAVDYNPKLRTISSLAAAFGVGVDALLA